MRLIILWFLSVFYFQAANAEEFCTTLDKSCIGQKIRVTGTLPVHGMAHPSVSIPVLNPQEACQKSEAATEDTQKIFWQKQCERAFDVDRYFDVDGRQIIITISKKNIKNCEDRQPGTVVEVTGLLAMVDLGGEPGTMSSYRNYHIEAEEMTCR